MKYFYLIATGIGLLTTIYYKSKKSIFIEKMTMTRDQSTQTLISLDRDEGILVKETILNRGDSNDSNNSNDSNDNNSVNNFVNKWYDIIL